MNAIAVTGQWAGIRQVCVYTLDRKHIARCRTGASDNACTMRVRRRTHTLTPMVCSEC
jgi:hypothetical protein